MVTRFVHAKIKPGMLGEFRRFYDEQVLPALQGSTGCLYACLIQSTEDPDDFVSFTLWETEETARAHESRGAYSSLVEKARDLLIESSEWRVQLTKDLKLEYAPVPEEPVVRSYRTITAATANDVSRAMGGPMYVRLTSWRVDPEKLSELKGIYENEIVPTLRDVKGCRYAFLVESPDKKEVISVTIWDTKVHADAYEQSGVFDTLVAKIRHTFSQVYQWKMKLSEETPTATVTTEELVVKPYQVVTGKKL